MAYQVYLRDWWIDDPKNKLGILPGPGPKELIKVVETFQEARDYCVDYNKTHDPGRLSRKAEFESV